MTIDLLTFLLFYDSIGKIYYDTNDYSTALIYYQRSLRSQEKYFLNQPSKLLEIDEKFAIVFAQMNNYSQALTYAESSTDQEDLREKIEHVKKQSNDE